MFRKIKKLIHFCETQKQGDLNKIDLYIIKKFLGTFALSIGLITSIAIIFHFSEHIDEFMENQAPLKGIVFDYYLNLVPFYVNLFSFIFTFIAVVYFTSKMASHTEIIAIRASGMSFARMLLPYMISAFLIASMSYVLGNYIIPPSNITRLKFENEYINNTKYVFHRNIHKQIDDNTYMYLESYRPRVKIGYKFSLEQFRDGEMISKLTGSYIKWDTTKNKWRINDYVLRRMSTMKDFVDRGVSLDTVFRITPDELSRELEIVEVMALPELNEFIEEQRFRGSDAIKYYLVEKYKRTAFPFSTFILTLIGVAIGCRRIRGGTGMHIGLGLLVTFSYILFMQFSFQFSIEGTMDPLLAVWIPNIIFSVVAGILYYFAPK